MNLLYFSSAGGTKCHPNTYSGKSHGGGSVPEEDRRAETPTAAICRCHYGHLAPAQRRRAGLLAATATISPGINLGCRRQRVAAGHAAAGFGVAVGCTNRSTRHLIPIEQQGCKFFSSSHGSPSSVLVDSSLLLTQICDIYFTKPLNELADAIPGYSVSSACRNLPPNALAGDFKHYL